MGNRILSFGVSLFILPLSLSENQTFRKERNERARFFDRDFERERETEEKVLIKNVPYLLVSILTPFTNRVEVEVRLTPGPESVDVDEKEVNDD